MTLDDRLRAAATSLRILEGAVAGRPGSFPAPVRSALLETLGRHTDIELWRDAVGARDGAQRFLDGLHDRVDAERRVVVAGTTMPFTSARLFGAQAYVAAQWALADRITDFAGKVVCLASVSNNPRQGAQAVAHFIQDAKHAPAMLHGHLRDCFGWPVGIAYAVRNHLVHDAGVQSGVSFFASGDPAASPFAIGNDGMDRIKERAEKEYKVKPEQTRIADPWPWSQDDVRVMLARCHCELDEALGLLLLSATRLIEAHVGFLLGEL